ncbi:MAG: pyridoxal-phosphate dependent enzyme [Acidimicrobiales bacterium]
MSQAITAIASSLVCRGCGTTVEASEPYPFRCPRSGDGGDHVLRRVLGDGVAFPPAGGAEHEQPFVRFRSLLHSYHLAVAGGMSDSDYVTVVHDLDRAVEQVDGHGFRPTPFRPWADLAAAGGFGHLMVKDETGNVSGSHKARHLFGLLVHLEVVERLGLAPAGDRPPLAIASCGNAALAAAVVAAAGKRRLLVFMPTDADGGVVRRLESLGAEVTACPRQAGVAGDPTYHRMQAAIAAGALPFTCQGNENGLAIEGGETLGYEMALHLAASGEALDHIVVQVGGGALATAVADAFAEAARCGMLDRLPHFHTLQTESAWPLKRAFDRVSARLPAGHGPDQVTEALAYAAHHRTEFMWPWETVPHSIAHGILDDETYDWLAVVGAMLATGGEPVVAGEDELAAANELAVKTTGIPVDPTGSSGLAGALLLRGQGVIGPDDRVAVLFTGVQR